MPTKLRNTQISPENPRYTSKPWQRRSWIVTSLSPLQRELLEDIARATGQAQETLPSRTTHRRWKRAMRLPGRPGIIERMRSLGYEHLDIYWAIEELLGKVRREALIQEVPVFLGKRADQVSPYAAKTDYILTAEGKAAARQLFPHEIISPKHSRSRNTRRRRQAFHNKIAARRIVGAALLPETPMETQAQAPAASPKSLASALLAATEQVEKQHVATVLRDAAEKDPVEWCRQVKWKVETKDKGIQVFEPWPHQKAIMRMFADSRSGVVPKSRQTGVTTCIMSAAAWGLLFRKPLHMHVVANKEEVAVESCLNIAKLGLELAELPVEIRRKLSLGGKFTTHISFEGHEARNYIRAHACTPGVGRSFAGNTVLMEEVAYMQWAREAYLGLGSMIEDGSACAWLVSTYNGEGDFFCEMVDNGPGMGFEVIPIDWRVRPGRDEAWKKRSIAKLGEEGFAQEHDLGRVSPGEAQLDLSALEKFAARTQWIGGQPIPGHVYSKGIDQSSLGPDKTVCCVIDMTVRPRQVVALLIFKPKAVRKGTDDAVRDQQKMDWIGEVDARWPGPTFIDGTNEKGIATIAPVKKRFPVSFAGGSVSLQFSKKYDKIDKQWWIIAPRPVLVDRGVSNVNFGTTVVHPAHFGVLSEGLASIKKGVSKRHGRNPDETDAFLLANIPIKSKKLRTTGEGNVVESIPQSEALRGLRGQPGKRRVF
jgi:hypothetical protein